MMYICPGLFVNTPHGVGVVACVRGDGMVVTRLSVPEGTFTGYFHPSCLSPAPHLSFSATDELCQASAKDFPRGFQAPSKDGMTPGVAMLPPATKGFSAAQPRKPCRALENPSTSTSPPSKRRRSTGAEIPHLQ